MYNNWVYNYCLLTNVVGYPAFVWTCVFKLMKRSSYSNVVFIIASYEAVPQPIVRVCLPGVDAWGGVLLRGRQASAQRFQELLWWVYYISNYLESYSVTKAKVESALYDWIPCISATMSIYNFTIDLAPDGVPFGAKSIGKV